MTDHWPRFIHFVKAETDAGGPDCQLHLLLNLPPKDTSPVELMWLVGCYGASHCIPTAWATWCAWRPEQAANPMYPPENPLNTLEHWLRDHWTALPVRPEMRSHRMPEKRAKCLQDFAQYALDQTWADPTKKYDELWEESQEAVKFFGRYMCIKVLELMRRVVRSDVILTDVRAKDAWSPRITLGMLWPENAAIVGDRANNSDHAVHLADKCADQTLQRLGDAGVVISYFQLQVLLCNFKEMTKGTFYPGAGMDEEMNYLDKAEAHFPDEVNWIYSTRRRIFQLQYLGECNLPGWRGVRKEEYSRWKDHPDFVSA